MQLRLSRSSGKPSRVGYEDSGVILEINPYSKSESAWIEKLNNFKARPDWESLSQEQKERYSGAAMAGTILSSFDSFTQPGEDGEPDYVVSFDGPVLADMEALGLTTQAEQLLYQDEQLKQFVFEYAYQRSNFYDQKARETVKKSLPLGDSTAQSIHVNLGS